MINSYGTQTLWSYIFAPKSERFFGHLIILFRHYTLCFVYEWSETLCTYQQCLIDCNAQKKSTGSTIRFCNLASSIEITYMPVAIEPRRFGKHKMHAVMPREVRKQSLDSHSSESWCSWQKRTFSSAKYTNRITLSTVALHWPLSIN